MEEKELEDQLVKVGTRLLESPPSANDELLELLNQVESCLVKVEQSPSNSMVTALRPTLKALVAKDILKHSDMDVKVAVASCISEITRITAPDAPYEDDMMKDIFQIIVTAFENLHDLSSTSYVKRVSILETVAKVRSCVVMLDLECDTLILEMFQHFFRAIRDSHPDNVFSSMETIMTLVIEESEDIASELLTLILSSVKKEDKDVSPISCRLGEKVIDNCAEKLKPYLMQEVQSAKISLDDYSKVVASICEETHSNPQHNELEADETKHLVKTDSDGLPQDPEKLEPEASHGKNDPQVNNSSTAVMSNGTVQTVDDDSLANAESSGKKLEHSHHIRLSKTSDAVTTKETGHLESLAEAGSDQATKRTRKSGVGSHSRETSEDSQRRKKVRSKEADSSHLEGSTIKDVKENENASDIQPSANQDIPEGTRAKRGRSVSKRKSSANTEAHRALLSDEEAEEAPKSTAITSKDQQGNDDIDKKLLNNSGKKKNASNANEDETLPSANADSKEDPEEISDSDERLLRRFGNKARAGTTGSESSGKLQGGKTKRQKRNLSAEKITSGESSEKNLVSPSKHVKKSSIEDQETPKAKLKHSHVPALAKPAEDDGSRLVGFRIKVFWPEDERYYYGVVDSFNRVEKKHKVLYDDGDEETLLLKDEKWKLIDPDEEETSDDQSPDDAPEMRRKKARTSSGSSNKAGKLESTSKRRGDSASKSKDIGKKKANKSKGDSTKSSSKLIVDKVKLGSKSKEGTSRSGGKSKGDNPKAGSRSKDNTSSKSKDDTPKADRKSKDDHPKTFRKSKDDATKEGSKPKEEMLKTSSKSKDGTPKAESKSKDESSKSKDDTTKTGSKSKDYSAKTVQKSNDGTPKAGGKSKGSNSKTVSRASSNGASAKGKSSGKATEDTTKGKSLSSAKGQSIEESDSKSGKKRRRGMQG